MGLVPQPCGDGLAGVPAAGGAPEIPPVTIPVGKLGAQAYTTSASLQNGVLTVAVLGIDADGNPYGSAGDAEVSVLGPDGVSRPLIGFSGSFTGSVSATAGERVAVVIDADGDGAADGTGSILVPGAVAIAGPAGGSTTPAAGLRVRWTDSASATPGYSVLYHVGIGEVTGADRADYFGSAREFAPLGQSGALLLPGHYAALVQVYSGPAATGATAARNITGPTVSGVFSAYGDSMPAIELDLTN